MHCMRLLRRPALAGVFLPAGGKRRVFLALPSPAAFLAIGLVVAVQLTALPAQAIRNGEQSEAGRWPFHVGMFIHDTHACGGTLIAPRWVLTAAHCPQGIPKNIMSVYVGSQELVERRDSNGFVTGELAKGPGQLIKVAAIHTHPSYDHNRTHDIALLELATPAPASYGTAALPNLAIHNSIASAGEEAVAVGWGTRGPGRGPSARPLPDLQQVTLGLRSLSDCRSAFGNGFKSDAHLCTLGTPRGSDAGICAADSGGPLFVRRDGIDYQVGINSFAENFNTPSLSCVKSGFTKVASYVDWINYLISPRPPAPPANLRAVAGDSVVSLLWDAAGTHRITGYEVRHRAQNGAWGDWTAVPNSGPSTISAKVAGLTNGSAYGLQVRAVNWDGAGEPADEKIATPMAGVDLKPSFEDLTLTGWSYIKDALIITRELPVAGGGDGDLTYAISPTLPAGLSFDADTRELSGTPTATKTATEYSYTATDTDGDVATLRLVLEVSSAMSDRSGKIRDYMDELMEDRGITVDWDNFSEAVMERADLFGVWLGHDRSRGTEGVGSTVPAQSLAGFPTIRELTIKHERLSTLPGTFVGYHNNLRDLRLHKNLISTLPDGVFDYMNLSMLYLHENTVDPFTLTVSAKLSDGSVYAHLPQAAPREISVDWTASGGVTASGTAIIPAGKRDGVPFSRSSSQDILMTLSNPRLTGITESTSDKTGDWRGFNLAVSATNAAVTIPAGEGTDPPAPPPAPPAPASEAPTANAGADITVAEGAQVTLNGSASQDPDGGALTYAWTQLTRPLVTLSDATVAQPTFTAPSGLTISPEHRFSLTVTDPTNVVSEPDFVAVRVISKPRVSAVAIVSNPPVGGSYRESETIRAEVTFTQAVAVEGSPQLTLNIGGSLRPARYTGIRNSRTLVFEHQVSDQDMDANGIGIAANALALNGGAISYLAGSGGAAAVITHNAVAEDAGQKVDGSVVVPAEIASIAVVGAPESGDTYRLGEPIIVNLRFDRPVTVTGAPQVALTVGMNTRQAAYFSGSGGRSVFFYYKVQAGDSDTNGLSIAANAVSLNGGGINGTTADLTHNALAADATRKVDGSLSRTAAAILVLLANSPEGDATYKLGEEIEVEVWFDRAVAVTGTPYVEIRIGTNARQAAYVGGIGNRLTFRYALQADDLDADGIHLAANALKLSSGAITDTVSGGTATLTLGAVAADSTRKTDGSQVIQPRLRQVQFNVNSMPSGADYGAGEVIWVEAWFDRAVTVTGTPRMALNVGGNTRQAAYHSSAAEGRMLFFHYVVRSGERDADGVSIAANALDLNGGTIKLTANGVTDATVTHAAVAADPTRKVGNIVPPSPPPPRPPPVSPPPPPPNRAPEVVRPMDEMSLRPGAYREIDAAHSFRDRDGDRLSYSARSSNPAVATATVRGSLVTVAAKAPGAAAVTLSARDRGGLSASLVFSVRVKGPPQVDGEIADLSLLPGTSEDIDPSAAFVDPDGDPLSYAAQSADPSVATAAYLDGMVRISAEAPGLTTVTITATDVDGLSASLAIAVSVKGPPRVLGEIAALSLPAGASAEIDAAAKFRDPNEDPLTYQAVSSNAAAAVATLEGGVVKVVAKARGRATVTITAVDVDGLSASLNFPVAVAVPLRNHELLAGGDVLTLPLSSLFADAAGLMAPAASSSDAALVAAEIADGILTLTSLGEDEGAAAVSVAATGGDGWRRTLRLQVEVAAPGGFFTDWRLHWIEQLMQAESASGQSRSVPQ